MRSHAKAERRVFVCYVPGLDHRRVSRDTTPTIAALIERYPSIDVTNLPGTDLAPVLLSGTAPHQSLLWQVSIDQPVERTAAQRVVDLVPDFAWTTLQCVRKAFDKQYDLSAIPPWRRRRFTLRRLSEDARHAAPELLEELNGFPSLISILSGGSKYRFTLRFGKLDELAEVLPDDSVRFDFLQNHALDIRQHWYIDDDEVLNDTYARTDRLVARLVEQCESSGHTFVLLSDHGQDPVHHIVPLVQTLRKSGVPRDEYSYYCEVPTARLWFHTDRARATIKPLVDALDNCHLVHYTDMHQYGVKFEDNSFGDYYVICDPGSVFFPHDFWHPLANVYLALFAPSQRCRLFNPVHRGSHGYLPHQPSERGFMVVADDGVRPIRETMSVLDFAPTMLSYFGEEVPEYMSGANVLDG